MNVWERLSALPGLGLGWLAVDTLTPTSWAGQECFCPRGTWSCLGCWHRDTQLSPSGPRSSSSAQSERHRTADLSISLIGSLPLSYSDEILNEELGPWPRACWYLYTEQCPESGEHLSVTCCFLDLIRCLGSGWLQNPPGLLGRRQGSWGQSTGKPPAAALIAGLLSQGGKDIAEAPTLCPGFTCSQEAESHTAEDGLEPTASSGTQDSC